jgi:hypothetical protein
MSDHPTRRRLRGVVGYCHQTAEQFAGDKEAGKVTSRRNRLANGTMDFPEKNRALPPCNPVRQTAQAVLGMIHWVLKVNTPSIGLSFCVGLDGWCVSDSRANTSRWRKGL